MEQTLPSRKFYPAIDGLRAFSFLIVFFFHAGVPGFSLGWGGVTIFFVISGFLITEILLNNKNKESYFKFFFIRRSLRIFPLYYFVILIPIIYNSIKYKFPFGSIYYLTYMQNYFNVEAARSGSHMDMLSHTWTLAIEEQFYLFWPFIIFFVKNKYLKAVMIFLIFFSIFFRTFGIEISKYNYINTISQLDSLIIGSFFALLVFNKTPIVKLKFLSRFFLAIGATGVAGIFIYLSNINSVSLYHVFMNLGQGVTYTNNQFGVNLFLFISFFAIGLILACVLENNIISRIFNNSILIHIGKISYGMYIFHYPVLHFLRLFTTNVLILSLLGLAITYLVSLISFNTIESYFNRLKTKFTY